MLAACIADGFRSARKRPALIMVLWLWSLLLAAMAAFPAWFWLGRGFDLRPESDVLLSGFNFSLFAELGHYDRSPVRGILSAILLAALALAFLANPLISGGLLETLRQGKSKPSPMKHFCHGAGLYFWRFLRLLVYASITAAILLGAVSRALSPLVNWFDDHPWETGYLIGRVASTAALSLVAVWILLALDFARIRTLIEGSRRTLQAWCWSLLIIWRRPLVTFGLFALNAVLFAAAAGIYTAIFIKLDASTWTAIGLIVVLQQLVLWYRAGLRVNLVAAELACYQRLFPPTPAPPPVPNEFDTPTSPPAPPAEPPMPSANIDPKLENNPWASD